MGERKPKAKRRSKRLCIIGECPNPAAKGSRWCEECRTRLQNYDPAAEKQQAVSR